MKNSPIGQEGPKVPKMHQKWGFWGILKEISSIHTYFLLLEYEITNFLWKLHIWKKSGFRTKNSRPNRMQDYFDCNISQTSWCVRLNFCVWLNISRSNKFIQLIQVGVVENELSSKVDFLHVGPQKLQACPRWLKAMS